MKIQWQVKKNDGVGPAGLIFLALAIFGAIILTAAVYLPPITLILALLYFEVRASVTPKDFALTDKEKNSLSEYVRYREAIVINRHRIQEQGSNLKRNRDGSYHRGSKLGVQLNEELEELDLAQVELDGREHAIRTRSRSTFGNWSRVASFQFALRLTITAYLLSIADLYLLNPPFIDSFSQFVGRHVLMRISGVSDALYGRVLVSSLGAGLLLAVLYKVRRARFERHAQALGACTDDCGYTVRVPPHRSQELDEMWNSCFEAIADAANRYQNGTYYEYEYGPDAEANNGGREKQGAGREEEWYEILGVSPAASAREINEAWRHKMTKNHPDRVAELDPEFRALAEERTKRLNAAREEGLHRSKAIG